MRNDTPTTRVSGVLSAGLIGEILRSPFSRVSSLDYPGTSDGRVACNGMFVRDSKDGAPLRWNCAATLGDEEQWELDKGVRGRFRDVRRGERWVLRLSLRTGESRKRKAGGFWRKRERERELEGWLIETKGPASVVVVVEQSRTGAVERSRQRDAEATRRRADDRDAESILLRRKRFSHYSPKENARTNNERHSRLACRANKIL